MMRFKASEVDNDVIASLLPCAADRYFDDGTCAVD